MSTNKTLRFSQKDKQIGKKIYRKFVEHKKNPKAPLISFKDLYGLLNADEKALIKKIISINPRDYGKDFTTFYGIKSASKNLIAVKNQKYFSAKDKKVKKVRTQYLPKPVFAAFLKIKEAMRKDLGTSINVVSGYRSPAYQAVILFIILFENKWSMRKTMLRVTLPGCSEHGFPPRQAVDVLPECGIGHLEDFDKTKEYQWLLKNAQRFDFALSYQKGNNYGVMFEPWHWHYTKQKNHPIKFHAWREAEYLKAITE